MNVIKAIKKLFVAPPLGQIVTKFVGPDGKITLSQTEADGERLWKLEFESDNGEKRAYLGRGSDIIPGQELETLFISAAYREAIALNKRRWGA